MMQGKTILITGATNGIGRVAALELAKSGAHVVIVGRNPARIQETLSEIKAKTQGTASLDSFTADLSIMSEVRRLAAEFKARYTRLDVLINNAGAIFSSRQETAEGYEMTFALNHLNYFLLTHLLLDTLKASAPARIINVSSDAHQLGPLNFDDLQVKQNYSMGGFRAYGRSKLMNIMFTYELARRLSGTPIAVNAMHPGSVATGFGHGSGLLLDLVMKVFHRFSLSPERGADTIIYMASSPEVEGITGKYFYQRKVTATSDASYDEAAARRLWEISEQITGLTAEA